MIRHLILSFTLIAGLSGCLSTSSSEDPASLLTAITTDTHSFFPIDAASKHSLTTCNDCHGKFDSFKGYECIDCHTHEPTTTTANHLGISGFAYDSASCYGCHPTGSASVSIADHDTVFPISSGTHAGLACTNCHSNPLDRRVLACITCHSTSDTDPLKPSHDNQVTTDARHSSSGTPFAGYEYLSNSCYGCHPRGTAAGTLNHDAFFPTSAGTNHAGILCASCHLSSTDRTQLNCANQTCHPSSTVNPSHLPSVIPGYVYDSTACYSCHPQGTSLSTSSVNHAGIFLRGAGTTHAVTTTKVPGTSGIAGAVIRCRDCHSDPTVWANVKCTTCHVKTTMDTAHTVVRATTSTKPGGYAWATADCLSCHSTPSVYRVSTHNSKNSCANHRSQTCRKCHNVESIGGKPYPATDFSQRSCNQSGCHTNRSGTTCN